MVIYVKVAPVKLSNPFKGGSLKMNGVGFKGFISDDKVVVQLGYSHYLARSFPVNSVVKIHKQRVAVRSMGLNLLNCLVKLRYPDSYKGRGVQSLPFQAKLKEGKKR